jgi:hypothetical protein
MSKIKYEDYKPFWTTIVSPNEYDFDGQIKDLVKGANEREEFYTSTDVGKIIGMYLRIKEQDEILREVLGVLKTIDPSHLNGSDIAEIVEEALSDTT